MQPCWNMKSASQRGGLKPSWHRRGGGGGRSGRSCEVYRVEVWVSVCCNWLSGNEPAGLGRVPVEPPGSKSSTPDPKNCHQNEPKETHFSPLSKHSPSNISSSCCPRLRETSSAPLWALLFPWCETPPGLDWGLMTHRSPPPQTHPTLLFFFYSRSSNLPLAPQNHICNPTMCLHVYFHHTHTHTQPLHDTALLLPSAFSRQRAPPLPRPFISILCRCHFSCFPPPNHHPTRQVIFQGFLKKKNQDVTKEKSLEAHSQDDQTYLFVFFLQDVEEEAVRACDAQKCIWGGILLIWVVYLCTEFVCVVKQEALPVRAISCGEHSGTLKPHAAFVRDY